jgi:hypothetical protein
VPSVDDAITDWLDRGRTPTHDRCCHCCGVVADTPGRQDVHLITTSNSHHGSTQGRYCILDMRRSMAVGASACTAAAHRPTRPDPEPSQPPYGVDMWACSRPCCSGIKLVDAEPRQ